MSLSEKICDKYRNKGDWMLKKVSSQWSFPLTHTKSTFSSFRVCTLSLQTGLLLRYLCYSWGSLYPEFTPAELTGGRGRHLAGGTCKVPGHGRKTGASRCLQLKNTLLHSFGYSQIKSFSCITDSSHATHAWMQPVCVSGGNIISRWSTFSVGLHPFASC